jgi:hypothetical protein
VKIADVDGDGNPDIIAGNYGLNSKIKADEKHPAKLYVDDFDKNGQVEPIFAYYKTDGKLYPVNLKGDIENQLPYLKKKFPTFDSYAGKTIDQVFTDDELKHSSQLTVQQTQSCIFYNDGKGNFTMKALPLMAQITSVYGILVADLNNDGIKDIFLGGNFYGLKPEIGRLDASYGVTLLGNKNHTFNYLPPSESGLFTRGEVRDIEGINTRKGNYILVARNNDSLQIFKKTNP